MINDNNKDDSNFKDLKIENLHGENVGFIDSDQIEYINRSLLNNGNSIKAVVSS